MNKELIEEYLQKVRANQNKIKLLQRKIKLFEWALPFIILVKHPNSQYSIGEYKLRY